MDPLSSADEVSFNVSVINLLNFGGPNVMRCGDDVYKSNHLIALGVVSQGKKVCKIEGLCLQSSQPDGEPHKIDIQTADDFDEWTYFCSCKSGNGSRCKHIYAALLHIHTVKSLKVLTCTEKSQSWGKVAEEVAEGVLEPDIIKNLPEFVVHQPKRYDLTQEQYDANRSILLSDTKSALSKFIHLLMHPAVY